MRSAEEILKKFEEDRFCGFEEFHKEEIIKMMNVYAKEVFEADRDYYMTKVPKYKEFEDLLKEIKEPQKKAFNELDPYGEENWDEKENKNGCSVCGTELKPSDIDWSSLFDDI